MDKLFKILAPKMPNFVRFEKEALEFAELMKQTFLEHYQSRKAQK